MADGTVKREDLFYTTKVSTCGQNGWKPLPAQIRYWGRRHHPLGLRLNHGFIAKTHYRQIESRINRMTQQKKI